MKRYKFFILVSIVFLLSGCKSSEETVTQQTNEIITLPPEFLKASKGLSSEEVRQIFRYGQQMGELVCDKVYNEISHSHNAEDQKQKVLILDRQIDSLQYVIDNFLYDISRQKAFDSYHEALKLELANCRWIENP